MVHETLPPAQFNRNHALVLLGLLLVVLSAMAATGSLKPLFTPDTDGYLTPQSWPTMLAVERPPFYRWLFTVLTFGGAVTGLLPCAQTALYVVAGAWFLSCLTCVGLPAGAVLAVGITLSLSNALLLTAHWVHPEISAIAFLLLALGATVRFVHERRASWRLAAITAAAGGAAYLLRPSFLTLIVALPLLGLLWRLAAWQSPRIARALVLLVLLALPFVTVSSARLAVVKDFNIVSFGGFAMSGLAALTLAPEVLPRLPQAARPLAEQVLRARTAAETEGRLIGIPPNSEGVRSFSSVAIGYFDVLARTYDDVAFGIVLSHRQPGEDWVSFNSRMQRWSLQVILAAPERYLFWVVGASTRLAGRLTVTNLAMVLALLSICILVPLLWMKRLRPVSASTPEGTPRPMVALSLIALAWLIATAPLIVLVTFPASRYIDSAAVLVAAPVWYLCVEGVAALRRARSMRTLLAR